MTLYCPTHKEYLPEASFHPSVISKRKVADCKECSNTKRRLRRNNDPIRLLQSKLYQSEYKFSGVYPTKEEVESILEKYGRKSVINVPDLGLDSAATSERDLCIVRIDPNLSLREYPDNAVVVTSKQAARLPRTREARVAFFQTILSKGGAKKMDNNVGELHGALALLKFGLKNKDPIQKDACMTEAVGILEQYLSRPVVINEKSSSSSSEDEEEEDGEMHLSSDSDEEEPKPPLYSDYDGDEEEEQIEDDEDRDFEVGDDEPIKVYDPKAWDKILTRKRGRSRRYDEEEFPEDSEDDGEDCGEEPITKETILGMGGAHNVYAHHGYEELTKNAWWKQHFGDTMAAVEANCGASGEPNEYARETIDKYIRGPTLEGKNVELIRVPTKRRAKCCMCGGSHTCHEVIQPGDMTVATTCRHLAAALIAFYQVLYKGNSNYEQLYKDLRAAMDEVSNASANKRDKRKVKRGRRKYNNKK